MDECINEQPAGIFIVVEGEERQVMINKLDPKQVVKILEEILVGIRAMVAGDKVAVELKERGGKAAEN